MGPELAPPSHQGWSFCCLHSPLSVVFWYRKNTLWYLTPRELSSSKTRIVLFISVLLFTLTRVFTMFQQTIKNFNINYNVANERGTFSSGDLITGHISFDLTTKSKIISITMELRGKADVHWSTGGGGGRRRRRQRRHYSAKVDFFNLKSVILQENHGMQSVRPFACMTGLQTIGPCSGESHSVCVPLAATGERAKLQPGTHVYPFTCQIPHGCV